MVLAAVLEDYLERGLRAKLPRLSGKVAGRWFSSYGPLNSLSAKLEFAFVLELIGEHDRKNGDTVRKIRNKFAHTNDYLSFESPEIVALCKRLGTYKVGRSMQDVYVEAIVQISGNLKATYDDLLKRQGRSTLD